MKKRGAKFPVILFLDNHASHRTLAVHNLCKKLEIIVVCLYPNATHIIQPCDVSYFKPLKTAWFKFINQKKVDLEISRVCHANFAPLFKEFIDLHHKPEWVISGFKTCGIYPWDAKGININKIKDVELRQRTLEEKLVYVEKVVEEKTKNYQKRQEEFHVMLEKELQQEEQLVEHLDQNFRYNDDIYDDSSQYMPSNFESNYCDSVYIVRNENNIDGGDDDDSGIAFSFASDERSIDSSIVPAFVESNEIDPLSCNEGSSQTYTQIEETPRLQIQLHADDSQQHHQHLMPQATPTSIDFINSQPPAPPSTPSPLQIIENNIIKTIPRVKVISNILVNPSNSISNVLSGNDSDTARSFASVSVQTGNNEIPFAKKETIDLTSNFENTEPTIEDTQPNTNLAVLTQIQSILGSNYKKYTNRDFTPKNIEEDYLKRIVSIVKPKETAKDCLRVPARNFRKNVKETERVPYVFPSEEFTAYRSKTEKIKHEKEQQNLKEKQQKQKEKLENIKKKAEEKLLQEQNKVEKRFLAAKKKAEEKLIQDLEKAEKMFECGKGVKNPKKNK